MRLLQTASSLGRRDGIDLFPSVVQWRVPTNSPTEESELACPYFMPVAKLAEGAWPHPARLPLGCGWSGQCMAPGHEGEVPSREALQEFCNLGYAASCGRLPRERAWDAVRFAVRFEKQTEKSNGSECIRSRNIQLEYVCELAHRPKDHGRLEFDGQAMEWVSRHSDSRLQKMAECFLETYLVRRKSQTADGCAVLADGPSEREL